MLIRDSERPGGEALAQRKTRDQILAVLAGKETPTADEFRDLVLSLDSHAILAKVFLLEGTPFVFKGSPMKYVIFREQLAERFNVGSQDICIVGSAKLGYSPAARKFGTPFSDESDVDVVIISEDLFYRGSRELFQELNKLGPSTFVPEGRRAAASSVSVPAEEWRKVKEGIRNFVYNNLNPGLLPQDHPLRSEIFGKVSGSAGLFLALEPQVFVSRIRCRIFKTWKAAEDYYANSLREAMRTLQGAPPAEFDDLDEGDEVAGFDAPEPAAAVERFPSANGPAPATRRP